MPNLDEQNNSVVHYRNFQLFLSLGMKLTKRINKKQFLLRKKLFGGINHHQLLNEYILHKFFAFYQTLLVAKSN